MTEFAVGTKVFKRTEKLRHLLDSINHPDISTVYIADDGETAERQHLYEREYPFELSVLDLDYNAGVSRGRNRLFEASTEEYLLIVDSDHRLPENVPVLLDQLKRRPEFGGVAGSLIEPELGRLYQPACDLAEHDGELVKSSRLERKEIDTVAGNPLVPFDFVPNAVMFRRSCLEDYRWDPEFINHREHVDFFVGHWKQTDWQFGVCPTVFFEHYPGGDDTYSEHRFDDEAFREQSRYFQDKWGYDGIRSPHGNWFDTHKASHDPTMSPRDLVSELPMTAKTAVESLPQKDEPSLPERAYEYYTKQGLIATVKRAVQRVRK